MTKCTDGDHGQALRSRNCQRKGFIGTLEVLEKRR